MKKPPCKSGFLAAASNRSFLEARVTAVPPRHTA